MSTLNTKQCEACNANAPPLTKNEIDALMPQLPDWRIITVDNVQRIKRNFIFANFQAALNFTNQVGALAEASDHHPQIITEWGAVTVLWWTHKINGLHLNDLIMSAKTSELFSK